MGRRLEIELTSVNESSCTWRAAGAKQPKGEMPASLLYAGAKAGDVVKVEATFFMDGIEINTVHPPSEKKVRSDVLEMKSRKWSKDELVTTQLSKKSKRNSKGPRGKAKRNDAPRRPRPKRISPKRVHREAVLAEFEAEHKPIIEQLMSKGMPGVRQAIKDQNAKAKADGKPEMDPTPIMKIAEKALPKVRLAEWKDKADSLASIIDEVDLRDLRSVVVSGKDVARDDETKKQLAELSTKLEERIASDHEQWVKDLDEAISQERLVAALKISSRPVKAGTPLAPEVASKLTDLAAQGLSSDSFPSRWIVVLESLAFSPVRSAVTPASMPSETSEELIAEVRRLSDRLPQIAKMFGVDPASVPAAEKKRRPKPRKKPQRRKPEAQKDTLEKQTAIPKDESAPAEATKSDEGILQTEDPKAEAAAESAEPEVKATSDGTPSSSEPETVVEGDSSVSASGPKAESSPAEPQENES